MICPEASIRFPGENSRGSFETRKLRCRGMAKPDTEPVSGVHAGHRPQAGISIFDYD